MLSAGGIAFETGVAAARAYTGLWRTESAAKSALQRAEKTDAFSNKFIKGRFAHNFCRVEFQLAGQGSKPKTATVDTRKIPDPAGHLRRLFGELVAFRVIEEPADVESAVAGQDKQEPALSADVPLAMPPVLPAQVPPAWMTPLPNRRDGHAQSGLGSRE